MLVSRLLLLEAALTYQRQRNIIAERADAFVNFRTPTATQSPSPTAKVRFETFCAAKYLERLAPNPKCK